MHVAEPVKPYSPFKFGDAAFAAVAAEISKIATDHGNLIVIWILQEFYVRRTFGKMPHFPRVGKT